MVNVTIKENLLRKLLRDEKRKTQCVGSCMSSDQLMLLERKAVQGVFSFRPRVLLLL